MRIKVLPPNPSLDHLKRQAKQLLAGLRESQPDSTLSDAQRVLAGEYGFRTWPDLKAEVDRRLATGERGDAVADARFGAPIAAAFGLGELIEPATVISYEFQGPMLRLVTVGFTLYAWAVNHDGTIDARAAGALVDGYAEVAGERPKVDLEFFGSTISAHFNQMVSRMTASLRADDEAERRRATVEVTEMLTAPLSIARLEELAAATA